MISLRRGVTVTDSCCPDGSFSGGGGSVTDGGSVSSGADGGGSGGGSSGEGGGISPVRTGCLSCDGVGGVAGLRQLTSLGSNSSFLINCRVIDVCAPQLHGSCVRG